MKYGALDFESYYEAGEKYSLRGMGTWEYCADPRFDAYLMAWRDETGTWVGEPRAFDWERIRDRLILMHNANFDGVVLQFLVKNGVIPSWIADPVNFRVNVPLLCTADMTAYLRVKRDLSSAAKYLLGAKVDKGPRDMMKGLHWGAAKPGEEDIHKSFLSPDQQAVFQWKVVTAEQRKVFLQYAAVDAETCYALYEKCGAEFPEHERRLSEWQRNAGWRGICVDQAYVDRCIGILRGVLLTAGAEIPWKFGPGTRWKTPLARDPAIKQCGISGIPAPASFAKDNAEFLVWLEKYEEKVPWVKHLSDWRRANSYLQKFETIKRRIRRDGTVPYTAKYFGAHTGRPSAAEDLNVLNLDRNPKFDCDIRKCFRARPGKTLVLMDQSQIEPRCLNLLAGNMEFLDLVRQGQDPYEAHARQTMGWAGGDLSEAGKTDKAAKRLRDTAKGRVLAGGYGCGFRKFIGMLPRYGIDPDVVFSDPVTIEQELSLRDWLDRAKQAEAKKEFDDFCRIAADEKATADQRADALKLRRWWINSFKQIMDYRYTNPKIVALWKQLGYVAELSAARGEDFSIKLPSGRRLHYFKPFIRDGEVRAWMVRGEHPSKLYGGLLAENCLAGGSFVLSETNGWIRLDSVTAAERVWDGTEFVQHGGLVAKGVQQCIPVANVMATPDHLFWASGGWTPAENCTCLRLPYQVKSPHETSEPDRAPRWCVDYRDLCWDRRTPFPVEVPVPVRADGTAYKFRYTKSGATRGAGLLRETVSFVPRQFGKTQVHAPHDQAPGVRRVAVDVGALPEPETPGVAKLWGSWDSRLQSLGAFLRGFLGRHGGWILPGVISRPGEQQQGVLPDELSVGHAGGQRQESPRFLDCSTPGSSGGLFGRSEGCRPAPQYLVLPPTSGNIVGADLRREFGRAESVYDLRNCGPRHCFAVRAGPDSPVILAHNCTQAFAREVFSDRLLALLDAGVDVLWTVYDEYVCEVDAEKAQDKQYLAHLKSICATSPTFAPLLPVAVSQEVSDHYKK